MRYKYWIPELRAQDLVYPINYHNFVTLDLRHLANIRQIKNYNKLSRQELIYLLQNTRQVFGYWHETREPGYSEVLSDHIRGLELTETEMNYVVHVDLFKEWHKHLPQEKIKNKT